MKTVPGNGVPRMVFVKSHPVVLFGRHKVFHPVTTQPQYIVNNTQFWLHVSVSSNHPQANIYYMMVHSMCAYLMGFHIVYTNKN